MKNQIYTRIRNYLWLTFDTVPRFMRSIVDLVWVSGGIRPLKVLASYILRILVLPLFVLGHDFAEGWSLRSLHYTLHNRPLAQAMWGRDPAELHSQHNVLKLFSYSHYNNIVKGKIALTIKVQITRLDWGLNSLEIVYPKPKTYSIKT